MCALEGERWSRRCEKRGEIAGEEGDGEEEERKRTKERWRGRRGR